MAVILGLGRFFYIPLELRYTAPLRGPNHDFFFACRVPREGPSFRKLRLSCAARLPAVATLNPKTRSPNPKTLNPKSLLLKPPASSGLPLSHPFQKAFEPKPCQFRFRGFVFRGLEFRGVGFRV